MEENKLYVVDGETLADLELPPVRFCIRGLLPQGLSILGGAPKVGKSWLALDLCVRVAKGEPLWGMETTRGTTLYLCLEDTLSRIQSRLNCVTEEPPANAYFATMAGTLADDLETQIWQFLWAHPDTALIVIDTFQMIRGTLGEPSYGSDYQEIRRLKQIADQQNISILLVHHLRKQSDRDPVYKLSGTTGISGSVDGIFVLEQKDRGHSGATLFCTGRDMESRTLELSFSKEKCVWELISDSMDVVENQLPQEMRSFLRFLQEIQFFWGSNSTLAEQFNAFAEVSMTPKALKQMMNRWRQELQLQGVSFHSYRSNGQRLVEVSFSPPVTEVT